MTTLFYLGKHVTLLDLYVVTSVLLKVCLGNTPSVFFKLLYFIIFGCLDLLVIFGKYFYF